MLDCSRERLDARDRVALPEESDLGCGRRPSLLTEGSNRTTAAVRRCGNVISEAGAHIFL